jgi:tRNA threonylcarbamoyladenosine biosynthesis protein TsaB
MRNGYIVFIEASLKEAGLTYKDLSAIAVRDQGLILDSRIGVSAAKGLCFALELPLIAVDTLKVLASQASISSGLIVPMIDAQNGSIQRYFAADFEREMYEPKSLMRILSKISRTLYFVGDCAEKCSAVLTKENFVFLRK